MVDKVRSFFGGREVSLTLSSAIFLVSVALSRNTTTLLICFFILTSYLWSYVVMTSVVIQVFFGNPLKGQVVYVCSLKHRRLLLLLYDKWFFLSILLICAEQICSVLFCNSSSRTHIIFQY